jgi:hypothetical protein
MSGNQQTLGQAIDQILTALGPLDEAARRTALVAVCMQLEISISDMRAISTGHGSAASQFGQMAEPISPVSPPSSSTPLQQSVAHKVDIRTLKDQKKPSSARQMACLVGFYLQELAPETERKETITTADLEKYFKQAGFRLPGTIGQVLKDAKAAGYFDAAARGEYKLNAVGYNLVAHNLPSGAD